MGADKDRCFSSTPQAGRRLRRGAFGVYEDGMNREKGDRRPSTPVTAIERSVLNGFGEVRHGQMFGAFKIGNGASDFEDAIVGAGCKSLLLHGTLKQPFRVGAELAVGANLTGGHLGVGVDFFFGPGESLALALAGGHDAGANLG